jgi:hypothetical protein
MRFARAVRVPFGMFISLITSAVLAGIKPEIRVAISGGAHVPLFGICAVGERPAGAGGEWRAEKQGLGAGGYWALARLQMADLRFQMRDTFQVAGEFQAGITSSFTR